jgi:hypothetical protein
MTSAKWPATARQAAVPSAIEHAAHCAALLVGDPGSDLGA